MIRKKKKRKTHIPFRVNFLFFIVFLLFTALVLQLGVIQIVKGDTFKRQLIKTQNFVSEIAVPRGKFYDRDHRLMVDNKPLHSITYTQYHEDSQMERIKTARRLAKFIKKDTSGITERDIKDYWILTRPKKALDKLTKKERKTLNNKQLYHLQLERISEKDVNEISPHELEVLAIKLEFDRSYMLTPQTVKKKGVTKKEYAVVSEHLQNLEGVDVATSWERNYLYNNTFRNFIGNITTENQGIPRDELDYFLARDYKHNDRIGISYLEKQYEDILHGQKQKNEYIVNASGDIIEKRTIQKGQKGKDLVLTIDIELQKKIEEIIEEELLKAKRKSGNQLLDSAFVVMMDPKTGEIFSLAGKKYSRDDAGNVKFLDYSLGTTNNAYVMGSAVKGATILTGYQTGVIYPGQTLLDTPIKIKATKPLSSWYNMGWVNDIRAIKESSNVYMFRIAMKLGQYNYQYNEAASFNNPAAFEIMRNYFGQFGLGVKTGIDLPIESTGYKGSNRRIGSLMYFAIGQFDSYTPLQLAQYVSTIANDGYRMKPRLVKEIRQTSNQNNQLGKVVHQFTPKVLNRIEMKESYINRVQEGFRQVMQEPRGTAYSFFKDAPYSPAGKTGTAETFYYEDPNHPKYGDPTTNLTLVGYAPYNNPKIAFSVVVPHANSEYRIDKHIGRKILDAFFNSK